MKKIFALLALFASASMGITNVTLPYVIDTASIPKVKYVDKNDSALKWGVNNLGDTVNAATGTGVLVRKTGPAFGNLTAAKITASDTVIGANLKTGGSLSVTGNETVAKITASDSVLGTVYKGTNGVFSGQVSAANGGTGVAAFQGSGSAGATRDMLSLQTAGVNRWLIRLSSDAESGSDAGSYFQVLARADGGSGIDIPISIVRANGGLISLGGANRDVAATNGLTVTKNLTADSIISHKFYDEGTFTATLTGVSGTVTTTAYYVRVGKAVTVMIPQLVGTSNSTACTITGAPASILPTHTTYVAGYVVEDNSISYAGFLFVGASFQLGFYSGTTTQTTTFTSSGTKGLLAQISFSYQLQ